MFSKQLFQITHQGISANNRIMLGLPQVADILYWDGHSKIKKVTSFEWAIKYKDWRFKLAEQTYAQNKSKKGYYLNNHVNKRGVCLSECSLSDNDGWNEMAESLVGKYIGIDPDYALADDLPDVITEEDLIPLIIHGRC